MAGHHAQSASGDEESRPSPAAYASGREERPSQGDHAQAETPRPFSRKVTTDSRKGSKALPAEAEPCGWSSLLRRDVVGWTIVLNLFCLHLELDTEGPYWGIVEGLFVTYYVLEMSWKVQRHGLALFRLPDGTEGDARRFDAVLNTLDLLLAVMGVGEVWILMTGLTMAKYTRLFRLLRAVRIFYHFQVLTKFVGALYDMMANLVWIFGVIGLVCYVSALFLTLYVSDAAEDQSEGFSPARVYFSDVMTSMFSLFQVTTMDGWTDIAAPLVAHGGVGWRLFFVCFIVFTAWTMISLLTAVVSDAMIQMTQNRKELELQKQERNRMEFIDFLQDCFIKADADGNGLLDMEEFDEMIKDDRITAKMEELGVVIPTHELRKAFSMLDVDESGELTIEEFTMGLSQLQQSLTTKHVVAIDYALQRVSVKLSTRIDHMSKAVDTSKEVGEQTLALLERLDGSVRAMRSDFEKLQVGRRANAAGNLAGTSGESKESSRGAAGLLGWRRASPRSLREEPSHA